MCGHHQHTRISTHPPPDKTPHAIRYPYSYLHKLFPRPYTHLPTFKNAHLYTCTHNIQIRVHNHAHSRADTCTRLHYKQAHNSPFHTRDVCTYMHPKSTDQHEHIYKYREACVHTHKHTRKHEGSGRSQARTCINTDHGLSTAVCPFVMPASCHQVVASEMARCPAKIRRGQPYSWHLLCQVCPEEQLLCPPGGLAPHSGTLHGGACGLFPSECRVGGGRGRARAGGIPGCVPEFTYPLGKLFMDSRGSQSWGRGRSANSQTQLCLSRQGFPPPELQTYRAMWTC